MQFTEHQHSLLSQLLHYNYDNFISRKSQCCLLNTNIRYIHSYCTIIMTINQQTSTVQFTEHQHSLLSQLLHYNNDNYISRPAQCSLLNINIRYFHSYCTIIMTIISADNHSEVYWTPTSLLSESLHYNKYNYNSRPAQCGLLNPNFATFRVTTL